MAASAETVCLTRYAINRLKSHSHQKNTFRYHRTKGVRHRQKKSARHSLSQYRPSRNLEGKNLEVQIRLAVF